MRQRKKLPDTECEQETGNEQQGIDDVRRDAPPALLAPARDPNWTHAIDLRQVSAGVRVYILITAI